MNVHAPHASVDEAAVRQFFEIYHEAASVALTGIAEPGVLQLIRLWPDDKSPTIVVGRYKVGDVDAMTDAAIIEAGAGHNVYVEGRTVRADTSGRKRGDLDATLGVFALVADADADKGRDAELGDVEPSLSVESSPGNRHHWFFLQKAIAAPIAQKLGATMRQAIGADNDTGNPTQPYRVAGTPNYPGPKKQERGRIASATAILTEGRSYTAEDLGKLLGEIGSEQGLPAPRLDGELPAPAADHPARPIEELLALLSPKRQADLEETNVADRSAHFMKVTGWLKGDGYSQSETVELWKHFNQGAGHDKYGIRLAQEAFRAWHKTSDVPASAEHGAAVAARIAIGASASDDRQVPLEWFDDIKAVIEAPYLVKGVLDHGAMSVVYGPSNSGKTFFALDLAFHVAIANPWRGRRVSGGAVLYLAAEGGNGIANRIAALRETSRCCDVPFALRRAGLDLLKPDADKCPDRFQYDRLILKFEDRPMPSTTRNVALFLNGARVTSGFREALFDASNRAGITPNEFVITAAAEKLARSGASFPGVFRSGDHASGSSEAA